MECKWLDTTRHIFFWSKLVILILGVIGNILTYVIIKKAFRKKTSNFILRCLVSTYTLLILCLVVHTSIEYAEDRLFEAETGKAPRKRENLCHDLQQERLLNSTAARIMIHIENFSKAGIRVLFFQAIWTVVLIMTCQCVSIRNPQAVDRVWNLSYIRVILLLVFIISCIAELPLVDYDITDSYNLECEKTWKDVYEYIYTLGMSSMVPLVILGVCAVYLKRDLIKLERNTKERIHGSISTNPFTVMLENTEEITLVLFSLTAVFLISSSFWFAQLILVKRGKMMLNINKEMENYSARCVEPVLKDISHMLLALNSGSSFVIFAWLRPQFRVQLKRLFMKENVEVATGSVEDGDVSDGKEVLGEHISHI